MRKLIYIAAAALMCSAGAGGDAAAQWKKVWKQLLYHSAQTETACGDVERGG